MGGLDGIQILPLQVLNQGDFEHYRVGNVLNHDRDRSQARKPGSSLAGIRPPAGLVPKASSAIPIGRTTFLKSFTSTASATR